MHTHTHAQAHTHKHTLYSTIPQGSHAENCFGHGDEEKGVWGVVRGDFLIYIFNVKYHSKWGKLGISLYRFFITHKVHQSHGTVS